MPSPENVRIPDWAKQERGRDMAWIGENLHVFWPAARMPGLGSWGCRRRYHLSTTEGRKPWALMQYVKEQHRQKGKGEIR